MKNRYEEALAQRQEEGLLRSLPKLNNTIDFYSNDYLGFAQHEQLVKKIEQEVTQCCPTQTGSTGSRLLSGNNSYIENVEKEIAAFHHVKAALVFNSGFTANVGLLSCIANKEDTLIIDELIHASLIDGARLSKATRMRFKHNDINDLEHKLKTASGSKIVVVESLYSMDGDICPLQEVVNLCKLYDAKLIVDEAHAIGVYGNRGEGIVGHLGLENDVFATVVTYGKAMGCHGAAILGAQWLKDYLINFSRPFIFSTAPSFHQLAAIKMSYQFVAKAHKERLLLQELIQYVQVKKIDSGFDWIPSRSQIQAVLIPGNGEVIAAANHLQNQGIAAMGIRYPSVARGSERIRICLHAYNTKADVDFVMSQLTSVAEKETVIQ